MIRADSALVAEVRESPNWRDRKIGEHLRLVIVHGTWMASDEAALARLTDKAAEVSCHYYICRDGRLVQLVNEHRVAFHAGKSKWRMEGKEVDGLNGWSLGIELGNAGPFDKTPGAADEAQITEAMWQRAEPYTAQQYETLIALLKDIFQRQPTILPGGVLGHSDVSPGRKSDPGKHFSWQRLVEAGVCEREV